MKNNHNILMMLTKSQKTKNYKIYKIYKNKKVITINIK